MKEDTDVKCGLEAGLWGDSWGEQKKSSSLNNKV